MRKFFLLLLSMMLIIGVASALSEANCTIICNDSNNITTTLYTLEMQDDTQETLTAIFDSVMFLGFGMFTLWLSFTITSSLSHPLRVVTWVCCLTSLTSGMANGIIDPQYIIGIPYIFYGLIVIEIILFIVDSFWLMNKK